MNVLKGMSQIRTYVDIFRLIHLPINCPRSIRNGTSRHYIALVCCCNIIIAKGQIMSLIAFNKSTHIGRHHSRAMATTTVISRATWVIMIFRRRHRPCWRLVQLWLDSGNTMGRFWRSRLADIWRGIPVTVIARMIMIAISFVTFIGIEFWAMHSFDMFTKWRGISITLCATRGLACIRFLENVEGQKMKLYSPT